MVLGWELDSTPASTQLKIPVKPYDFAAMVPLQLRKSMELCKKIKTIIVGGGEVHPDLKMMIEQHPARIFETYGMTETITHIALRPLNQAAGLRPEQIAFKALPGVTFDLDDRNCLIIRAPKISSERIVTNDVVDLDSETSFHWLGRYDHIINSGGIKFVPEVLEKKLNPIIEERFFIGCLPDKILGQKIILLVEGAVQKDLQSKLIRFQNQHVKDLSQIELPKEIYFLEHFEETVSGKVKRTDTLEKLNLS
jgi:O-succinylbenzoic acid--CoA ligase